MIIAKPIELKKSLLLTWKILGLLVNTLSAEEKYPVLNRDNLLRLIQMQLSQKQHTFSQVLAGFLKSRLNFKSFEQKDERHRFRIFEITESENVVRKMCKSPGSEDRLTSNMVNLPKQCWNSCHSTLIIFIDQGQVNWIGKSLSYWYAKSWDCLLEHWLPMKTMLFLIETI